MAGSPVIAGGGRRTHRSGWEQRRSIGGISAPPLRGVRPIWVGIAQRGRFFIGSGRSAKKSLIWRRACFTGARWRAVQPMGDGRACCDERVLSSASGRLISGGGAACAALTASTSGHPRAVSMEPIEVVQGGPGGCHPASHDGSRSGVALGASLTATAVHLPGATRVSAVAGTAGARPRADCLGMSALLASRELWSRALVLSSDTHRSKSVPHRRCSAQSRCSSTTCFRRRCAAVPLSGEQHPCRGECRCEGRMLVLRIDDMLSECV